jgi:hypothetical protein
MSNVCSGLTIATQVGAGVVVVAVVRAYLANVSGDVG